MQLNQTGRHYHEVGGEVVPDKGLHEALNQPPQYVAWALQQELLIGVFAPLPGIREGFDLRLGRFACGFAEQQVIIACTVERRV